MSRVNDFERMRHMIEAADQAIAFSRGHTREDFHNDRQLLFAVTRCIEIIGEAASSVSPDTQAPNIAKWNGPGRLRCETGSFMATLMWILELFGRRFRVICRS